MSHNTSIYLMLRLLLEDRRRRDDELAEKRRRRGEQIAEERERYEREAGEGMRLMNQQIEALQRLVTESGKREALVRETLGTEKPKLTKLIEDDVEAYLTTFERMMAMFGVERARWAYMLAPQLTGRAQKAFAAMGEDQAGNDDALKAAFLKRYNVNEEAYR